MKSFVFLILFFACFLINSYGQANIYHPFPDSLAVWSVDNHNVITQQNTHTRYGLKGDTLLNGQQYKNIYTLWAWDTTVTSPFNTYYAGIREQGKRVYVMLDNPPEHLLYDFNLNVGDTIFHDYSLMTNAPDSFYRIVTAIDSFLLQDGNYRKAFYLAPGPGIPFNDTVVEGIGSITWRGLFNPLINTICTCGDTYTFSCFKELETVLYLENTFCSYCFCGLGVGVEEEMNEQVKLSPNPFSFSATNAALNFSRQVNNSSIIIYNSLGQVVKRIGHISGKTVELNFNLNNGLYLMSITEADKTYLEKLLVNN